MTVNGVGDKDPPLKKVAYRGPIGGCGFTLEEHAGLGAPTAQVLGAGRGLVDQIHAEQDRRPPVRVVMHNAITSC